MGSGSFPARAHECSMIHEKRAQGVDIASSLCAMNLTALLPPLHPLNHAADLKRPPLPAARRRRNAAFVQRLCDGAQRQALGEQGLDFWPYGGGAGVGGERTGRRTFRAGSSPSSRFPTGWPFAFRSASAARIWRPRNSRAMASHRLIMSAPTASGSKKMPLAAANLAAFDLGTGSSSFLAFPQQF